MRAYASFLSYVVFISCIISRTLIHEASSATATSAPTLGGNKTDWLALLAIKAHITLDPMFVMSSWNESFHFCQWKGVTCSHRHRRVTVLNLRSQSLMGFISPSIGNLSFLQMIDLSNNSFQGEVPSEIGRLFRLKSLYMANNSLEGRIPANLSSCSNLKVLSLGRNKFVAELPKELGSLSKLVKLYARSNNLEGAIPPSFGNLSSVKVISAAFNMFEGTIPESLGRLKSLTFLDLAGNNLSGLIPPSIYNLSYLATLGIMDNQLQGSLPHNIDLTLPKIQHLLIYKNQFSGSIPTSLSNASNLRVLDVSFNKFSGGVSINFGNLKKLLRLGVASNDLGSGEADDLSFMSSLTNCSNLRELFLFDSNFGGVLPNSIANLSTQLKVLSAEVNQLSGNIPTGIGNLVNLSSLSMYYNRFTGTLPATIGKLYKLQEVGFGKNNLSGEIPSSIGNLTLLNQLWLEENNFQGSIPSSLGNCQHLRRLHLYSNVLNGTIPREVISLSSLSISLNLAHNRLTGPLPLEVGILKNLVELDISQNELSGEIPGSLGSCTSLERLYMDSNSFRGAIPESLKDLRGVAELDLSHNNLSGNIPKYLGTFPFLWKINLSFNDLEGEVPLVGVFSNASAVAIAGNEKLCGGITELQLPICSTGGPRKRKFSLALKLIIPLGCGVLVLILMSSFLVLCWLKKTRNQPSSASVLTDGFMNISYGRLLKVTDGFSSSNLIGRGSFGSVYKGILEPDKTAVAVKVLNLQMRGASKSFMAECAALRNVRHRNLVKIVTACSSTDFHGNDFKALIYEFMPNGSLETWLHPVPQTSNGYKKPRSLDLHQRLKIAIDMASALDYLHNHCEIPIIHCDLKPSNILLDRDMAAHVGDFGLARFLQQINHETSQNQTSSVGIKGTIGYAAPEYGMGSEVSTHGDVYSYGILLLEMFTGKRPTDDMFKDGLNLHKLAAMALPDHVEEIVDHALLFGGELEEAANSNTNIRTNRDKMHGCLLLILKVGITCSEESPRERMDICDATKELLQIKDMLLDIGTSKSITIQKERR